MTTATPFLPNHALLGVGRRAGLDQNTTEGDFKTGFEPNRRTTRIRSIQSRNRPKPLTSKALNHRHPRPKTMGVTHYSYRYLDPLTGRWPSRDLIEERGGMNLYGFVRNDGVSKIDVIGLSSISDYLTSGWMGFEWLIGLNGLNNNSDFNSRSVPWTWFDKNNVDRDILRNSWVMSALGKFVEFCEKTPVAQSREWQYVGQVKWLGKSEVPWISYYWGYAQGDTRFDNKNVITEKWKEPTGKCRCKVSAEYYMNADDKSNFDQGKTFGPFGWDILEDKWFDGKGYDFYIFSEYETGYFEHVFDY